MHSVYVYIDMDVYVYIHGSPDCFDEFYFSHSSCQGAEMAGNHHPEEGSGSGTPNGWLIVLRHHWDDLGDTSVFFLETSIYRDEFFDVEATSGRTFRVTKHGHSARSAKIPFLGTESQQKTHRFLMVPFTIHRNVSVVSARLTPKANHAKSTRSTATSVA